MEERKDVFTGVNHGEEQFVTPYDDMMCRMIDIDHFQLGSKEFLWSEEAHSFLCALKIGRALNMNIALIGQQKGTCFEFGLAQCIAYDHFYENSTDSNIAILEIGVDFSRITIHFRNYQFSEISYAATTEEAMLKWRKLRNTAPLRCFTKVAHLDNCGVSLGIDSIFDNASYYIKPLLQLIFQWKLFQKVYTKFNELNLLQVTHSAYLDISCNDAQFVIRDESIESGSKNIFKFFGNVDDLINTCVKNEKFQVWRNSLSYMPIIAVGENIMKFAIAEQLKIDDILIECRKNTFI